MVSKVQLLLFSDDNIGLVFIFEMKLLYRHFKLTTEKNRHSQGSGPLGSGPIGPGSGYCVTPSFTIKDSHGLLFYLAFVGLPAEQVGAMAAEMLLRSINNEACVDEYLQDQV